MYSKTEMWTLYEPNEGCDLELYLKTYKGRAINLINQFTWLIESCMAFLTFECEDEILWCDHSNETSFISTTST